MVVDLIGISLRNIETDTERIFKSLEASLINSQLQGPYLVISAKNRDRTTLCDLISTLAR